MFHNYYGEALNLRRAEYVDHERYTWWLSPIRGYGHDGGGIEPGAHYEAEPGEHRNPHFDRYGLDVEKSHSAIG